MSQTQRPLFSDPLGHAHRALVAALRRTADSAGFLTPAAEVAGARKHLLQEYARMVEFAEDGLGAFNLGRHMWATSHPNEKSAEARGLLDNLRGRSRRTAQNTSFLTMQDEYSELGHALASSQPITLYFDPLTNEKGALTGWKHMVFHLPSEVVRFDREKEDVSREVAEAQLIVAAHEVSHLLMARFAPHALANHHRHTNRQQPGLVAEGHAVMRLLNAEHLKQETMANAMMRRLLVHRLGSEEGGRLFAQWADYNQRHAKLHDTALSLYADPQLGDALDSLDSRLPPLDGTAESYTATAQAVLAEVSFLMGRQPTEHRIHRASALVYAQNAPQLGERSDYLAVRNRLKELVIPLTEANRARPLQQQRSENDLLAEVYRSFLSESPDQRRLAEEVLDDFAVVTNLSRRGQGTETAIAYGKPSAMQPFSYATLGR